MKMRKNIRECADDGWRKPGEWDSCRRAAMFTIPETLRGHGE